jgi:ATP synthase protein I
MGSEGEPSPLRDLDKRLRELRSRHAARGEETAKEGGRGGGVGGAGVQVGIELFGGVLGGLIIGYGLDYWLGTRPLLLIVFFFLGAAAGMLNAYRYIMRAGREPGADGSEGRKGDGPKRAG